MRSVSSVASSSRAAEDAARAVLPGGNAADAIVAGVLAACAASPSVLLGSLQVLLHGPTLGARAIDGRSRQPGRGTRRPRGFVDSASIPDAAHVAVPGLPSALATTSTAFGILPLLKAAGPALELAKVTSKARAKVLGRVARMGGAALREALIADPWLEVAGVLAGGLLTMEDLAEASASIEELDASEGTIRVPWGDPSDPETTGTTAVLAVADTRGSLAIACWHEPDQGLRIEALDLIAPLLAVPVRRGETRVSPGTRLAAAAPITLKGDVAEAEVAGVKIRVVRAK